jgi:hypothetical protein
MYKKILIVAFALVFSLVTVLMSASLLQARQVIDKGLVLYWPFDNTTIKDDAVLDVWGENDGTLMGGPKTAPGKIGAGLQFDGLDDFAKVPEILLGDFTIEAWFKAEKPPGTWSRVFDGGIGGAGDVFITPNHGRTGGDIGYTIHASGGVRSEFGSGVKVTVGEWYHIAATYDKDGEGMKLYVNGEQKGSNPYNKESFEDWAPPQNWYLAKANWNDPLFPGIIDEFRLYDRVLSAIEIEQNMDATGLTVSPKEKLAGTWGEIKAPK